MTADQRPEPSDFPWATRWMHLARSVGLAGNEPVLVALSGGADSMLLLHLVARAVPRPRLLAVHVDHGLRGEESREDAGFCARQCARLGAGFARRVLELDPEEPNLEARAREGRYRLFAEEARAAGIGVILTGHHEDDALETLLLRWMRGTTLTGLYGPRARTVLRVGSPEEAALTVVRPLRALRREEVRRLLRDEGIAWREDSSNDSRRFARNRVRHELLPTLGATCGEEGIENLRAFASAVESFEEELAARTAHLTWRPPVHAAARRASSEAHLGGTLARSTLRGLAGPLVRRALWRLLTEGTGHAPSRALLSEIEAELGSRRSTRKSLPGGWILLMQSEAVHLVPPDSPHAGRGELALGPSLSEAPFRDGARLAVPGRVTLPDGRSIRAEIVEVSPDSDAPRSEVEVELDPDGVHELHVRGPLPGDRFHGLGAPGSRPVTRVLADAGIPREERSRVPLVFAGEELIWIAGLRPCDARRVRKGLTRRLRLELLGAAQPTLS